MKKKIKYFRFIRKDSTPLSGIPEYLVPEENGVFIPVYEEV